LELVARVKAAVPDVALTTDIMVGFPGESEEDFLDTLDVVRQARFAGAFTFIYSRRHGTPADRMENQIDPNVLKDRFDRLVKEVNKITYEIAAEKVGKSMMVLTEAVGKNGVLNGRTDDGSLVHFEGDAAFVGRYVKMKIVGAKTFYLMGEIVD
jgi:tRNA-2-methylthio-N6-dimethylallyladenosine synthase